eukprot:COSAG02_NODE_1005_length_15270_cov_11.414607_9_plen_41_part_00
MEGEPNNGLVYQRLCGLPATASYHFVGLMIDRRLTGVVLR